MISMIVAMDLRNGIGKDGLLPPWKSKDDMVWFREKTRNKAIILGRRTWESLPVQPLSERLNIVVSTQPIPPYHRWTNGLVWAASLDDAVAGTIGTRFADNIVIIGGATIYKQALEKDIIDIAWITVFKKVYDCDTYFDPSCFKGKDMWAEQVLLDNDERTVYEYKRVRCNG